NTTATKSNGPAASANAGTANAGIANAGATEPGLERRRAPDSSLPRGTNPPRVAWAKLNAAAKAVDIYTRLLQSGRGSYGPVAAARGEIEALAAELNNSA